jgi:hypothetical protein
MNTIRLCTIEGTQLLIVCEVCVRTLVCLENKNVISIVRSFMYPNSIFLSWLVRRLTSELMAQRYQDIITLYKTYCTHANHKPKMCYIVFLMTQQTARAIYSHLTSHLFNDDASTFFLFTFIHMWIHK